MHSSASKEGFIHLCLPPCSSPIFWGTHFHVLLELQLRPCDMDTTTWHLCSTVGSPQDQFCGLSPEEQGVKSAFKKILSRGQNCL